MNNVGVVSVKFKLLLLFVFSLASPAFSQGWYEPARGTDERQILIDTLRPFAEFVVGPPVEFVINDLRVSGDVAFVGARAQRPGGVPIDPTQTPAFRRGQHDPVAGNLDRFHAFYVKRNGVWQVVDRTVDAHEVWWSEPSVCARFSAVTPEVC